tara:strand:+ start:816 stop:1271 length:456 start_codon:yes stop_codon:yes gene_type:complete
MITKSSGFSLVELLVVVAILGILSAIGTVSYQGYVKSSKRTAAQNIVQQIALAQTEEYTNSGSYIVNEALADGANLEDASCDASNSSDDLEQDLFSGDNIITDKIRFEICVIGNSSTYKVIAKEYNAKDPYVWSGCEISLRRNSLPERTGC